MMLQQTLWDDAVNTWWCYDTNKDELEHDKDDRETTFPRWNSHKQGVNVCQRVGWRLSIRIIKTVDGHKPQSTNIVHSVQCVGRLVVKRGGGEHLCGEQSDTHASMTWLVNKGESCCEDSRLPLVSN